MYITVKLNSGQGASLGPNFTLSTDIGTITPNIATLDSLLIGVICLVSNSATKVYVTSQGDCTNTLTLNIPGATTTTTTSGPTTTTTTSSGTTTTTTYGPTTTTTLGPINCYQYSGTAISSGSFQYQDCIGDARWFNYDYTGGDTVTICASSVRNVTQSDFEGSGFVKIGDCPSTANVQIDNYSVNMLINNVTVNGISVSLPTPLTYPITVNSSVIGTIPVVGGVISGNIIVYYTASGSAIQTVNYSNFYVGKIDCQFASAGTNTITFTSATINYGDKTKIAASDITC